jgi:predicted O-linked N-acetylglucosamine transferase (SPINDLY family)
MLPLLTHHDRASGRVYCYSDARFADAMTHALRGQADVWRNTDGIVDERLAALIREDQIDILVDLTMHMDGNRLRVFAQSPAPVQVTYLAYCGTTGLPAMHYRLSDPYLDPIGNDELVYTEKSIRLPRTYWCYHPSTHAGDVASLPARSTGQITFGCLNNYSKVTDATWAAWFRILHSVPNATLIVQSPQGAHRQRPPAAMARQGLDATRLTFVGRVPMSDYFKLYDRIDIALDPFPYGGGTTTCDALWMGVPVVSLAGETAVSRGGLSILNNLGFPEWLAKSPDRYIQLAAELACDLDKLEKIRLTLRERMIASPLMDANSFAHGVEAVFREMWGRWCKS